MIVANELYTDQLYLQESTLFLFTSVYFDTTVSSDVQLIKNTLKNWSKSIGWLVGGGVVPEQRGGGS